MFSLWKEFELNEKSITFALIVSLSVVAYFKYQNCIHVNHQLQVIKFLLNIYFIIVESLIYSCFFYGTKVEPIVSLVKDMCSTTEQHPRP